MPQVITNIEDLRVLAQQRVPRMFYDYADSGSWTESTYRANESDFAKIKLRQRVAVNMEGRSTATKMIGIDCKMPVAIAPTGLTGMQHADGEILAAQAAEKFGVRFTLSTVSICSIEDVAARTTQPFWFQLYVMRDRDFVERLIDRAKVVQQSLSTRERALGRLFEPIDLEARLGRGHACSEHGLAQFQPMNFSRIALRTMHVLALCPQAHAHARTHTSGTACSLFGRGPADFLHGQGVDATARIEGRDTGLPGINDRLHALDSEGGFSDICAHNNAALRAGRHGLVLLLRR